MAAFAGWAYGALRPASVEWRLPSNVLRLESPYSWVQTVQGRGARWECTMTFSPWREGDVPARRLFGGLLWVIEDGSNPFADEWMVPLFGYGGKQGSATGTLTATGTRGANTVTIAGLESTPNPVFRGGDALQINQRVYLVRATHVDASGSSVVVPIWPPLRSDLSSAPVTLTDPSMRMRRVSPIVWRASPGNIIELDPIDFVEALP